MRCGHISNAFAADEGGRVGPRRTWRRKRQKNINKNEANKYKKGKETAVALKCVFNRMLTGSEGEMEMEREREGEGEVVSLVLLKP